MKKRLYKSVDNKVFCGVCGGIGEFFDIDPTIIRIAYLILSFVYGGGLLIYLLCALIIPKKNANVIK